MATPNEIAERLYEHWRKHESEPTYLHEWNGLGPIERRPWIALADLVQRDISEARKRPEEALRWIARECDDFAKVCREGLEES